MPEEGEIKFPEDDENENEEEKKDKSSNGKEPVGNCRGNCTNNCSDCFIDETLAQRVQDLMVAAAGISQKISRGDLSSITLADVLNYLRVVNYNFLALSKLIQMMFTQIEEMTNLSVEVFNKVQRIEDNLQGVFDAGNYIDIIQREQKGKQQIGE